MPANFFCGRKRIYRNAEFDNEVIKYPIPHTPHNVPFFTAHTSSSLAAFHYTGAEKGCSGDDDAPIKCYN